MRAVKIALSWAALVGGAVGTAISAGALHASQSLSDFIMAAGNLLAMLGIQPVTLDQRATRICGAAAGLCMAVVAVHAQQLAMLPAGTPVRYGWVFTALGGLGIATGLISRSPIPHSQPTPAPAPPPT